MVTWIAANVFLVELTLYYKKSEELQLGLATFLQGGLKKWLHIFTYTKLQRSLNVATNYIVNAKFIERNNI